VYNCGFWHRVKRALSLILCLGIGVTVSYFRPNTIYCGDCKEILAQFPNECVDLIYADPPFFSNRHYEVIWKDGSELRVFEDR
jgi:hypothetical protein